MYLPGSGFDLPVDGTGAPAHRSTPRPPTPRRGRVLGACPRSGTTAHRAGAGEIDSTTANVPPGGTVSTMREERQTAKFAGNATNSQANRDARAQGRRSMAHWGARALLAGAHTARAIELVSNLGKEGAGTVSFTDDEAAQRITTGETQGATSWRASRRACACRARPNTPTSRCTADRQRGTS